MGEDGEGGVVVVEVFFDVRKGVVVLLLELCCELFAAGEFECVSCFCGKEVVEFFLPVLYVLFDGWFGDVVEGVLVGDGFECVWCESVEVGSSF